LSVYSHPTPLPEFQLNIFLIGLINCLTHLSFSKSLYRNISINKNTLKEVKVLKNRNERKMIIAVAISLVMVLSAMAVMMDATSTGFASGSAATPAASETSNAPWTYPTTTMQEPSYTNGTYIMAATNDVEHLNIYLATDVYSFYLLDEIYDSATNLLPNETISPWLATSWNEYNVTNMSVSSATSTFLGLAGSGNMTTYDPINGLYEPVKYVYQVNIRPGVQWTDYSPGTNTYVFSNHTSFNGPSGNPHSHTYRYPSVTMQTYYVQSADFILSWKILQSSYDYSGSFSNVVNAVPVNNTTVDFYLSNQSATFLTYTLETPILPYHIWVAHDYSSSPGVWNYTPTLPAANSYNAWNVGYNAATGTATGLIGSGPFMFANNYGLPQGKWIFDQYWKLYVNPHYFVQYTSSLRQWTPKFYELYVPLYLSLSAAVTALTLNQVYQIEGGVTPTFLPTLATSPNTYVFHKPTTGYGYIQLNSFNQSDANMTTSLYGFTPAQVAPPLNITSVRQALNYAVNKVYLNSVVDEGYGIPGTSVVPDSDSVWQNHSLPSYSYDPAKAMALLNNTPGMTRVNGEYYYQGKQFTMDIQITSAASNPLGVEGALLIEQWWDQIGVKTTVTQEAFSTLVDNLITYGYQAIELGISGIVGDPTGDYVAFYTPLGYGTGFYLGPFSNITYNGVQMNGTAVDNLMTKLYNELNTNTNLTKRIQISDEIQGIAAIESTMINVGYGIDLFPIVTSQFTNVTNDTLSQTGFEYWNFMTVHLKTAVAPAISTTVPTELSVGVVPSSRIYYNGQYGNITFEVRNQYGAPVSGASLTIGVNPSGALLNITSLSGVTNSQGTYTLEFQVLSNQPLIYTSDYIGEINISAAATMSSTSSGAVIPGLGYTYIDVSPEPVAYKVISLPALSGTSTSYQPLKIMIYNPVNGTPIAGYNYILQVNSGILQLSNSSDPQATLSYMTPGNPYAESYEVNNNYNMTQIVGKTPANGTFTVGVKLASGLNFTALGSSLESYIFLGNYYAGAPMSGEAPYMTLAELTSASNPLGFGTQQPVEIPVQVTSGTPQYTISLTTSQPYISSPDGSVFVNVTVTNSTGSPVPNFVVDIVSQNALGANRGYFFGPGTEIQYPNLNSLFGSTTLPAIQVTTNANGTASVMFSSGLYQVEMANGYFMGYAPASFTDQYLVPADMFQISAVGMNYTAVADAEINSSAMVSNPAPSTVLAAYLNASQTFNGFATIESNTTHTLYVNSTLASAAGPSVSGVPFSVTASYGTLSVPSGSTGAGGSYAITYNAPNVTTMTLVTITITSGGSSFTDSFYVLPLQKITTTTTVTVTKIEKTTTNLDLYYALIVVFAILFIAFAALYGVSRGRNKPKEPSPASQEQHPPEQK
jgi:ABC-type transport system substrate-binding protein